ncbi:TetR/AcrR family transcriptional regulator [Promicromonospora iranensis]|uniref:AcrR family transcriptional regulator n=1 Tax=Promicromonospora iranensis TaxID=1105144 RepID=A0ABU2CVG6_9MICO|nr:TetR/AcrR family transcriptional regulator [Promicromonospora iranensis]MDR7385334.1 AcrR family transcriptional regulator [Promicromonospora iranensis]
MARTQAFDREVVVRAARALFWRAGFEGASVPALEEATGLSRSSIYNTFGSKRGLFDAAVQSYLDEVIRPRLRPLKDEVVAPEAVLTYLDGLRDAFTRAGSMSAANGCLLINTATAPVVRDDDVARVVSDYRAELRAAIGRGAAAYLDAATPVEQERLADAVTGLSIAAFALVRIAPSEAVRALATARDLLTAARLSR